MTSSRDPQTGQETTPANSADNETLDYWLSMFPGLKQKISETQDKAKYQEMIISYQKAAIAKQKVELLALKSELVAEKKKRGQAEQERDKAKKRVTVTSMTGDEIWQHWRKFIDKKRPGYRMPSTNPEYFYIGYLSDKKLIKEFRQSEIERLAKRHIKCRQYEKLKGLIELLKNTGFGKM